MTKGERDARHAAAVDAAELASNNARIDDNGFRVSTEPLDFVNECCLLALPNDRKVGQAWACNGCRQKWKQTTPVLAVKQAPISPKRRRRPAKGDPASKPGVTS